MVSNKILNSRIVAPKNRKIHLWIPELFQGKGGIQTYSWFFLRIIQKITRAADYDVFLKHDRLATSDINYLPDTNFHFTGKLPLPIRTFIYATQLMAYGLLKKPDLIISTHLNFTVVAYWLKKILGIPYWTVAHGIEAWNIKNANLQKALHNAELILAVSSYTRERLITEQNLNPSQIRILPNTFDADNFKIAPKPDYLLKKYNLAPKQPVILTVSRLSSQEQYKGYDKIINILNNIKKTIPNIHYLLVGKGDDSYRIQQHIEALGLQNHVTLTGFIPDAELCDHYNLCDVFAMPSKGEGFGIVYLEAMACGKPVLAGNQDGAIDALYNGQLGVLVNPDDCNEIAKTIVQIIQGNYPNPLIYQPELLRSKVIEIFGFESFKNALSKHLNNYWN